MTTMSAIAPHAFSVWWKDFERWDVKFYSARVRSTYPVVRLAPLIREHSERVKPFDYPETTFRILGVTNTGGIFHAYDSLGKKIKQPYQKVDAGDFAYNPYRVNVGSIGVVPTDLGGNYISPAYVVFATDKARLLSDYLILILKADWFNPMVRAATAGSVRQNLTFDLLGTLEIPLPPLAEQKAIVDRWRKSQDDIAATLARVEKRKAAIDARFLADLGLRSPVQGSRPKAFAVWWKEVERWGTQLIYLKCQRRSESKFRELLLSEVCKIGSGGTPQRSDKRYFGGSIPWVKTTEVRNEEITSTGESLTNEGLRNSSAKLYPKGSLLVAMYGQGATRGRTAKLAIDAATNQACAVLYNIDPSIDTDFLWYFLMSKYEAIRALASGNNQPNLNAEMIANLRIPLPPLAVQRQIVERVAAGREDIAREQEAVDRLVREINTEIETLILGTKKVSEL
jgi:restriction endonuclease S subunit